MILDCCHSGGMVRDAGRRIRGLTAPDDIRHRDIKWLADKQMWVDRDFRPINRHVKKDLESAASDRGYQQFVQGVFGSDLATRRFGRGASAMLQSRGQYEAFKKTLARHRPDAIPGHYLPTIVMSAAEHELAYEYRHGVISHGAFTFVAAKILRAERAAGRPLTFDALINKAAQELAELGYQQHPSIVGPQVVRSSPLPWVKPTDGPRSASQKPGSRPAAKKTTNKPGNKATKKTIKKAANKAGKKAAPSRTKPTTRRATARSGPR